MLDDVSHHEEEDADEEDAEEEEAEEDGEEEDADEVEAEEDAEEDADEVEADGENQPVRCDARQNCHHHYHCRRRYESFSAKLH